jgi:hypothetical protein
MSGTLTAGKLVLTTPTTNTDAFDRMRISLPNTLFELNHGNGKLPFLIDESITGTGATSIFHPDNSYIEMSLASTTIGKVIRQSFEYIPYQPGKSKFMLFSGVLEAISGGVTGVISRIGCFDGGVEKVAPTTGTGNGLYFELNNKVLSVCVRNNSTSGNSDNDNIVSVAQTNWNFDTFDGTGPSKLVVNDYSKAMIFGIDQEWLGIGRVRFGFYINGTFHLAHTFNHSGLGLPVSTELTIPYTRTAKLPIRYEIQSTMAPGITAEMRMICSTVFSEGGLDPNGITYAIGRSTAKTIPKAPSTFTPIISLKLKESEPYNRKTVVLQTMSIFNSSNAGIQWDLYVLPDDTYLTGAVWNDVNSISIAQYDVSATAVNLTNGVQVQSAFSDYYDNINFEWGHYLSQPLLNSSIKGKSKVFCLVGYVLSSNQDISSYGSLKWIELTT